MTDFDGHEALAELVRLRNLKEADPVAYATEEQAKHRAWELQRSIGHTPEAHRHPECSAIHSEGALLCDCGAIAVKWREEGGQDWQRYLSNEEE